jgi:SAM-dependent methyltransferase
VNDSWEAIARLWLGSEPQRLWRLHSDRVNAALVKRWLPPVKSVLKTDLFDEAVSGGLYPVLAERAERVVGIDASQAIVEAARRRNPQLEAVRGDVRDLPLGDEELEAVVSNSTLDHFDSAVEIEVSLRELARALQPGGLLVLTLDNPINPAVAVTKALPRARLNRVWGRVGESSARRGLVPYYVGATLGPRALQAAVDRSGFAPLELITIVHFPRIAGVVAGRLLEERASSSAHQRFLELLWRAERLGSWPTRLVTGHFLAIRARRRPAAPTVDRLRPSG